MGYNFHVERLMEWGSRREWQFAASFATKDEAIAHIAVRRRESTAKYRVIHVTCDVVYENDGVHRPVEHCDGNMTTVNQVPPSDSNQGCRCPCDPNQVSPGMFGSPTTCANPVDNAPPSKSKGRREFL